MSKKSVLYESLTGYQSSYINIRTITSWNMLFKGAKKIRFLDSKMYSLKTVCDVVLEKNDTLRVGQYYFNDKDVIKETVDIVYDKLLAEIKELSTKAGQVIYTVYFGKNTYEILSRSKFVAHYPDYVIKDELFIFLEDEKDEYPPVYCMEASHRKYDLLNVLEVLTYSSQICYRPAGEPTKFGKDFTYALLQDKVMHRHEEQIPNTNNMDLPHNGLDNVRADYKINGLNQLAEKSHVEKLVPPSKEPTSKPASKKDSKFTAEQDAIIDSVMEKEEINVSDVLQEGVMAILTLLSGLDFIVDIRMDIPDIAKKGCIFEKKIHILPLLVDSETFTSTDYSYVFDTPDENIVVCSDETYPKRTKKNQGKE